MSHDKLSRRRFVGACAGVGVLSATAFGCRVEQKSYAQYQRVKLVTADGQPITADLLRTGEEYVFFYPFVSTPCFLLDLGVTTEPSDLNTAKGAHYRWPGGVGPKRSIVGYSAICAHKLSHPTKRLSFIGYRPQPVGFLNKQRKVERRASVIQCCSEHSLYDPADGARVLSGPAPQPLATVALEIEENTLFATGIFGADMFDRYFDRFGYKLELEFGATAQESVSGATAVVLSSDFSRQRIEC